MGTIFDPASDFQMNAINVQTELFGPAKLAQHISAVDCRECFRKAITSPRGRQQSISKWLP